MMDLGTVGSGHIKSFSLDIETVVVTVFRISCHVELQFYIIPSCLVQNCKSGVSIKTYSL